MCNYIKANGEKCKKKSKTDFCYLHQPSKKEAILNNIVKTQKEEYNKLEEKFNKLIIGYKHNEKVYKDLANRHDELIKIYKETEDNLNEAVEVNIKNERLYNATKNEVKNINKTLEKKALIIKYKDEEIKALMKAKAELEEDANNYRIITEYEKEKQELINKGIDIYIYEYNNPEFYKRRLRRNLAAHPIS
jgi:small-conductance mechanosensitive channel